MGPKRKEEKETVVYPASKRKAAPFKPPRPSKTLRTDSHDSASAPRTNSKIVVETDDDEDSDDTMNSLNKTTRTGADEDLLDTDDDELPEPAILPKTKPKDSSKTKATSSKASARKKYSRAPSPVHSPSDSDNDEGGTAAPAQPAPPGPSDSDSIPGIPQALLVRILHEHFTDKNTRIDKHAIQVLQKYMEVFVRETIERARLAKRQAVADGEARPEDRGFLDLEDLEKVAPGIMLDF